MAMQSSKTIKTAKPYIKMWLSLEKKLNHAFKKLKKDINHNRSERTIQKDKNELMLLLGECNYLSRECIFLGHTSKKTKKKK